VSGAIADRESGAHAEFRHGMATLETGEMFTGLERYASGAWRQT
jgi:hypothetical protein